MWPMGCPLNEGRCWKKWQKGKSHGGSAPHRRSQQHDLRRLLELAVEFKYRPHGHHNLLRDEAVACYFAASSIRTRVAFETAIARLGDVAISIAPAERMGRDDTLEDTARVLSRLTQAIVIRIPSDDDLRRLAQGATVPVINARSDGHHPTQALADLFTMKEHFPRLRQLRVAYVGAGNSVAHSMMEACALAGIDLTVATPDRYRPRPELTVQSRDRAERHGGHLYLTGDPVAAVKGADVVYTDPWLSMTDPESQRAARIEAIGPYQVNAELMAYASPEAVFLHCLPALRGDEVTAEVFNGPQSLVFDQAENRLLTGQAVLFALVAGVLHGAGRDHRNTFGELIEEALR
jgi:ornithine carbamoyltransferase